MEKFGDIDVIIMMDCEHPIMSASAAYVTEGGGDILEIGFGMGISANYIQSHSISSHTIIEPHPQMVEKAVEWSKDELDKLGFGISGVTDLLKEKRRFLDIGANIGIYSFHFKNSFSEILLPASGPQKAPQDEPKMIPKSDPGGLQSDKIEH